jgi:hypothetical protein
MQDPESECRIRNAAFRIPHSALQIRIPHFALTFRMHIPHSRRLLVCILAALSAPADAQVRITVLDSTTQRPIPGAVLVMLDSAGSALERRITNDRGQYSVTLSPLVRAVQALRIGFRPRTVRVPPSNALSVPLDIVLVPIPTMLEAVRVSDDSHCPRRSDRAQALGLWEQARAGLLATVVARDAAPATMIRLTFQRTMDGNSDRIASQRVQRDSSDGVIMPFLAARSGADFVRDGFTGDSSGVTIFYGPDADVLLDESFARGYCFRLMPSVESRPNQVGLGFSAPEHESGRIDVDGTLWIDTVARALRETEFRYVGLGRRIEEFRPGGRVAFREMGNGVVLVDRWFIRVVGGEQDTVVGRRGSETTRTWLYAHENGGELARARWPDGYTWEAALGSMSVRALTHFNTPAVGTVVRLAGTDYLASVDSGGSVVIGDLLPGPYTAVVVDPALIPIGLTLPTKLRFNAARGSSFIGRLDVPTLQDYLAEACLADGQRLNGSAWLLARVMNADGTPVGEAQWRVRKKAGGLWFQVLHGATGSDGLIQSCNALQKGAEIEVKAWKGDLSKVILRPLLDKISVVPIKLEPQP